MAIVPTPRQIKEKNSDLNRRINDLKSAYNKFVTEWGRIDKEEKELIVKLSKHFDKKKMYDILKTIHSLK